MKKHIQCIIFCLIAAAFTGAQAQAPAWSVNSGAYEYSMTVTAILKTDNTLSKDGQDRVAAFVNGEVRGTAQPSVYQPAYDAYVVYLQVYSNKTTNETVTFRIYDQSENKVTDAVNSVPFRSDVNYGTTGSPYFITNNNTPVGLNLSAQEFDENLLPGASIGTFNSVIMGETYTYTMVSGTGDQDNTSFRIDGDQLKTNTLFNFEAKASYSIRVQTQNALGGTLQKQFIITVRDANDTPTALLLSGGNVAEGEPIGTLAGTLSTTDADAGDTHTYALVAGSGDMDNNSFFIEGNTLKTRAVFDYDVKPWYSVRIQTADSRGGVFSQVFTVFVKRGGVSNRTPVLNDTTFTLSEDSGSKVLVGILSAKDAERDVLSYRILEGNIGDLFVLDERSGVLTVNASDALDYDIHPVYVLSVMVYDGETSDTAVVTIHISDVITGLEGLLADAVDVYPNPITGNFISIVLPPAFEEGTLVSVMDVQGKVYSRQRIQGIKPDIRLPDVNGILVVKIEKNEVVIFKRVIRR